MVWVRRAVHSYCVSRRPASSPGVVLPGQEFRRRSLIRQPDIDDEVEIGDQRPDVPADEHLLDERKILKRAEGLQRVFLCRIVGLVGQTNISNA